VPGKVIDYEYLAAELAALCAPMHLARIYYDRWRIELLRRELAAIGVILPLMPCGQGFQDMAPCLEAFEALVAADRIRHGNNPVLRWCFSNALAVRDPANNRKLDKAKSYGRIDLAVAAVMAAGAMKACAAPSIELKALIA
jgi:phage terminase large subunit-like protein